MSASEFPGRDSRKFLEDFREIIRIADRNLRSDFSDAEICFIKQFLGVFHFSFQYPVYRTAFEVFFEESENS